MRFYSVIKKTAWALVALGSVLWAVDGAPTGLKVYRKLPDTGGSLHYPLLLGARAPPPLLGSGEATPRPGSATPKAGPRPGGSSSDGGLGSSSGLGGGSGLGGSGPGLGGGGAEPHPAVLRPLPPQAGEGATRPGFVQQDLHDAISRGYDIHKPREGEFTTTDRDDPVIGELYVVDNELYSFGMFHMDEIAVQEDWKMITMCDMTNDDDKIEFNPQRLSVSELGMNVWHMETGGKNPSAIEAISFKTVIELKTATALREGNALMGSSNWEIEATTTDPAQKALFDKITKETPIGGIQDKMNQNWIGKSVTKIQAEGSDLTYYLG